MGKVLIFLPMEIPLPDPINMENQMDLDNIFGQTPVNTLDTLKMVLNMARVNGKKMENQIATSMKGSISTTKNKDMVFLNGKVVITIMEVILMT